MQRLSLLLHANTQDAPPLLAPTPTDGVTRDGHSLRPFSAHLTTNKTITQKYNSQNHHKRNPRMRVTYIAAHHTHVHFQHVAHKDNTVFVYHYAHICAYKTSLTSSKRVFVL